MELAQSPVQEKKSGRGAHFKKKDNGDARDFGIEIDPKKDYIFETLIRTDVLRMQSLSGECQIYDPVEERIRTIWYIPSAPSIFKDELDEEQFNEHMVQALYFSKGYLPINGSDKRGIEYCVMHDRFSENKNPLSKKGAYFTLQDKEKYERLLDETLSEQVKALELIKATPMDELLPIARIVFNIIETTPLIVKNKLRTFAKVEAKKDTKSNAAIILESINNPQVQRKWHIQLALDKGIIELDDSRLQLVWGDTKNNILNYNMTSKIQDKIGQVVAYTYVGDGKEFYELIKTKLSE